MYVNYNAFFFWSHRRKSEYCWVVSENTCHIVAFILSVPSDRGFPTPCSMLCVQSYSALKMFEPIATDSQIHTFTADVSDLVGGLEHGFYDFPYIGNVVIPTDELIFFKMVET